MSESGVIPRPEERPPPQYIGTATDAHGAHIEIVSAGGYVRIRVSGGLGGIIYLDHGQREEFCRLYFEAERQAEATDD